jgi:hypothetical protein
MFFKFKKNRVLPLAMVYCLLSIVCLSGCSTIKKVQHMSQLLTLKHYSESQEQIGKSVEEQNKMFDEMVKEIQEGKFEYATAKQIFKRFGEPVFSRDVEYGGQMTEQWLYRYAKDYKGTNGKVYIYFDQEGQLVNFEYIKK